MIKNIIFDLGQIFLQVHYHKTSEAFINLGISNFDDYYKQDFVSTLFEELETGSISEDEFYNRFRSITNSSLNNVQIKNAWNKMLGSFWIDRLQWLREINKRYKVFLFSNTNVIHYNALIDIYTSLNLPQTFSSYFIKDYYSHTMHLRKPNVEAYEKIITENSLNSVETLFIDDIEKNILGAQQAGLHTLHFTGGSLQSEVENYLQRIV